MSVSLRTSHGVIKLQLQCQECPKASRNFLALLGKGYYDGTKFHRNIKGFIIQGGDASGTGTGGVSMYGGPFDDELSQRLRFDRRGVLAMANSGPNSNLSQFFITYKRTPQLNGKYTIFGKVIDGFETLDLLEREPTDSSDRPLNLLCVHSHQIHSNPMAENEQA